MTLWKRMVLFMTWPAIAALLLVAVAVFLICLWPLTLNNTIVSALLSGSNRTSPPRV